MHLLKFKRLFWCEPKLRRHLREGQFQLAAFYYIRQVHNIIQRSLKCLLIFCVRRSPLCEVLKRLDSDISDEVRVSYHNTWSCKLKYPTVA